MGVRDGESAPARAAGGSGSRGLSLGRLAWLQASHRRRSALGLGLCVVVALVLPTLLPLTDAVVFQRALAEASARDGEFTVEQRVAGVDEFSALQRDVAGGVERHVGKALLPVAAYASTGALHPTTINTDAVPAAVNNLELRAEYLDGLASHVEMLAGQLPPDGLGGGDTAVTMPQSGADAAGFALFDRVCVAFAGGGDRESRWCARIVGLWRPVDAHDPFWAGRAAGLELAMGRYDYFKLAQREPPRGTLAGVRLWADPSAVDSERAVALAGGVRALAAELQTGDRRVVTRLDATLRQLTEQHRAVAASLHLFTALLALLGLLVVSLVALRFLDQQGRLLTVLRARGFPPGRTWLLSFMGLVAPALYGLPVAAAACLLVVALVAPMGSAAGASLLQSEQARTALGLGAIMALLLTTVLGVVAGSAVGRELRPSLDESVDSRAPSRVRLLWAGVAGVLGLVVLIGGRLALQPGAIGGSLQQGLEALPSLGVLCLSVAAVALLPAWSLRLPPRRRSVSRLLAAWQLERAPSQHTGVAVTITLAAAGGTFAALAAAWARTPQTALEPSLRQGLDYGLGLGLLGILTLVVAASASQHAAATRRRLEEYSGLFGHGLTERQLRRSLVAEQAAAAVWSLFWGAILGLVLALIAFGPALRGLDLIGMEVLGVAAVVAGLMAAALAAGALARRLPRRLDLLPEGPDS